MEALNKKHISYGVAAALIILGISARLFPHPANFAPITAIALFAGVYLPKKWAVLAPLTALVISDAIIGFYHPVMMAAVYGSFVVACYLGILARKQKSVATIATATLIGSIIFFLVTNAAVWGFGTMYAKNLSGLMESYTMALPFFRNSLASDLFYVSILMGATELAVLLHKRVTHFITFGRRA